MLKILLGIVLTLFGMLALASTGLGTVPYNPTLDRTTFVITVKIIPRDKINEVCQQVNKQITGVRLEGERLLGCAAWSTEKQVCRIYVPEPLHNQVGSGVLSIWGHETLHCVKGRFHD